MGLKATFNATTRIITLTQAPVLENGDLVVDIDVKVDLYGDGKEDWLADETLRKLRFPITAVGGNASPNGALGTTYFLAPDWKIAPYEGHHRLRIDGNFFSEDGTTPFNRTVGNYNVFLEQFLSTLVENAPPSQNTISQGDIDSIADAVWDEDVTEHQTADSTGKELTDAKESAEDAADLSA